MSVHRLPVPLPGGRMHVRRVADDWLTVEHESASGESFGNLASFPPNERERAVRFALDALPEYAPCCLGEVEP